MVVDVEVHVVVVVEVDVEVVLAAAALVVWDNLRERESADVGVMVKTELKQCQRCIACQQYHVKTSYRPNLLCSH